MPIIGTKIGTNPFNTYLNMGFGSRDKNWGPCKYAQMSLLCGSPVLCGAIAWLVLVTVAILVRREVK